MRKGMIVVMLMMSSCNSISHELYTNNTQKIIEAINNHEERIKVLEGKGGKKVETQDKKVQADKK